MQVHPPNALPVADDDDVAPAYRNADSPGVIMAQALVSLLSSSSLSFTSFSSTALSHVYVTLAVSTALVSIGLALSLSIVVIYLLQLVVHKLPERQGIFSVFLPLGPLPLGTIPLRTE
ncbi:SSU1_2 [Sanghuangporus sanghuang]